METLATISAAELEDDPSARLWALVSYLAEHPEHRTDPVFRSFWLAYSYDAEVLNGGHLQYFQNCGTSETGETLDALHEIGAHKHAELLESCFAKVRRDPLPSIASLEEYSALARERSFNVEDAAYYEVRPEVVQLLEVHYAGLLARVVAVGG